MSELDWFDILVMVVVVLLALYCMFRAEHRCPQCAQWLLSSHTVDTIKSAFGKATFERRRCKGCGFTEHPPRQEHIVE